MILTAVLVGKTQSNISHPRATHTTRSTAKLKRKLKKEFVNVMCQLSPSQPHEYLKIKTGSLKS